MRRAFWPEHGSAHALARRAAAKPSSKSAVRTLGLPLILKTASSGYDGKGQILIKTAVKQPAPGQAWGGRPAWQRPVVDFAAELSVVVARGFDGRAVCYPVAMNRHERHILDATMMPAAVGPVVTREAHRLALAVAQAMGTVGVLTVEFFLTADGGLLVNEIAPRPHNSGHLTIEASVASQFDQQVRAPVRLAAGLGRPDHAGGDGQPAGGPVEPCRRGTALGGCPGARSGHFAAPLRKAIGCSGPEDGPSDGAGPRPRHGARARAGGPRGAWFLVAGPNSLESRRSQCNEVNLMHLLSPDGFGS